MRMMMMMMIMMMTMSIIICEWSVDSCDLGRTTNHFLPNQACTASELTVHCTAQCTEQCTAQCTPRHCLPCLHTKGPPALHYILHFNTLDNVVNCTRTYIAWHFILHCRVKQTAVHWHIRLKCVYLLYQSVSQWDHALQITFQYLTNYLHCGALHCDELHWGTLHCIVAFWNIAFDQCSGAVEEQQQY